MNEVERTWILVDTSKTRGEIDAADCIISWGSNRITTSGPPQSTFPLRPIPVPVSVMDKPTIAVSAVFDNGNWLVGALVTLARPIM